MQPLADLGVRQSPGDFARRPTLTVGERAQGAAGATMAGSSTRVVKASIRRRATGRRQ
jgi:hypothetical protein